MLPFFFRNYDLWVDAYFFFDNASTDSTCQIIEAHPKATVERMTFDEPSWVIAASNFHNEVWKRSRGTADWVVIVDVDEHLYADNFPAYLEHCTNEGITVIPAIGYEMVSQHFPEPQTTLCTSLTKGLRSDHMSKTIVFNPNAVDEINLSLGAHHALPQGNAVYPVSREVKLLHYKFLGFEYLHARQKFLNSILRMRDRANSFGYQYTLPVSDRKAEFEALLEHASDVFSESPLEHYEGFAANPNHAQENVTTIVVRLQEKFNSALEAHSAKWKEINKTNIIEIQKHVKRIHDLESELKTLQEKWDKLNFELNLQKELVKEQQEKIEARNRQIQDLHMLEESMVNQLRTHQTDAKKALVTKQKVLSDLQESVLHLQSLLELKEQQLIQKDRDLASAEAQLRHTKASWTYRLGHWILSPAKFLHDFFTTRSD